MDTHYVDYGKNYLLVSDKAIITTKRIELNAMYIFDAIVNYLTLNFKFSLFTESIWAYS